jgi:hypothetical protein
MSNESAELPYHNAETEKIASERAGERTGTIKATVANVDPAKLPTPLVNGAPAKHVPVTVHDVAEVRGYATQEVEYENAV